MKRKIIKQRDSYTVTLPIKWVNANNLEDANEIDMQEEAKSLVIRAEEVGKAKKATSITLPSDYPLFVKYVVTNAYKAGYDLVNLDFKQPEQIIVVQEAIDQFLMGFEVTKTKDNTCTIESISEPSGENSDTILRRMFLVVKGSLEHIHNNLTKGAKINLDELRKNTTKVDKYSYFSRRSVSKAHYTERSNFNWLVSGNLMLIQHSLLRIAKTIKKKQSKKFTALVSQTIPYFNNFYEGYFQKDFDKLSLVNKEGEDMLYKKAYSLFEKGEDGVALYHLAEFIRLVFITTSPVIGAIIDYSAE